MRLARIEVGRAESESYESAASEAAGEELEERSLGFTFLLLALGGAGLWLGADLLIEGARSIALSFGVEERVVAITVVAAGTGLPEFVATLAAVLHKKTDMAIGNVVGSNICNVLLVGGAAAVVKPLAVSESIQSWDLWWMLGISLLLGPFLLGRRLSRIECGLLLAVYTAYAVSLFVRST